VKTLVVLSGKGGSGKTSIAAGLVPFLPRPVLADADVDAANLQLLLPGETLRSEPFAGGKIPKVLAGPCDGCLECVEACRFRGILPPSDGGRLPRVDPLACEGCGACQLVCPQGAISMLDRIVGFWHLVETEFGPLVHARLGPAAENSGALVAKVRREAAAVAKEQGRDLVLVDGPPGTACPAISALTGANLALLVTEPTPSGGSDLDRVLQMTRHFGVDAAVVINKADLHPRLADELETRVESVGAPVLARFPYDEIVPQAIREGRLPACRPSSKAETSHG